MLNGSIVSNTSGFSKPSFPGARTTNQVEVFCYGANLSSRRLCERLGIPLCDRPNLIVSAAWAPTWSVRFQHPKGFATVEKRPTSETFRGSAADRPEAHGVVVRLSADQFAELSSKEVGYRTQLIEVVLYGCAPDPSELRISDSGQSRKKKTVVAFQSRRELLLFNEVPPSQRYLQLIVEGAVEHSLDSEYQEWLATVESHSRSKSRANGNDYNYYDNLIDRSSKVAVVVIALAYICWTAAVS